MTDQFTAQLSAYLDNELDRAARVSVESHLAECDECRAVLADLRKIVVAAPQYTGQAPARDLWAGITAGIARAQVIPLAARRRQFGWRELIAASIVMAAMGGGTVWLAVRSSDPDTMAVAPANLPNPNPPEVRNAAFAEEKYDLAVRELEQLLVVGRSQLDTVTVRVVEQSLAQINAAIAEARAAIQRDPANGYLIRQVTANMRLKLNLLRVATNAIAAKS
jgi:hypothetical protein